MKLDIYNSLCLRFIELSIFATFRVERALLPHISPDVLRIIESDLESMYRNVEYRNRIESISTFIASYRAVFCSDIKD